MSVVIGTYFDHYLLLLMLSFHSAADWTNKVHIIKCTSSLDCPCLFRPDHHPPRVTSSVSQPTIRMWLPNGPSTVMELEWSQRKNLVKHISDSVFPSLFLCRACRTSHSPVNTHLRPLSVGEWMEYFPSTIPILIRVYYMMIVRTLLHSIAHSLFCGLPLGHPPPDNSDHISRQRDTRAI